MGIPLGDVQWVGYNANVWEHCSMIPVTEEAMASCEHLVHAEEQMRDLLCVINDHLKLYDPDEDTYGSLLSVAHHMNEGLRELGYLLDQAEENGSSGVVKEVGH